MTELYFAAFLATLVSVGLKGFQHKNVIHNLYGWTALTSFAMATTDVIIIGLIVKADSLSIALFNGAGAALGMVGAMRLHAYLLLSRQGKKKMNAPTGERPYNFNELDRFMREVQRECERVYSELLTLQGYDASQVCVEGELGVQFSEEYIVEVIEKYRARIISYKQQIELIKNPPSPEAAALADTRSAIEKASDRAKEIAQELGMTIKTIG